MIENHISGTSVLQRGPGCRVSSLRVPPRVLRLERRNRAGHVSPRAPPRRLFSAWASAGSASLSRTPVEAAAGQWPECRPLRNAHALEFSILETWEILSCQRRRRGAWRRGGCRQERQETNQSNRSCKGRSALPFLHASDTLPSLNCPQCFRPPAPRETRCPRRACQGAARLWAAAKRPEQQHLLAGWMLLLPAGFD